MKSSELLHPLTPITPPLGNGTFPTIDVQFASRSALLSAAKSEGSKLTLFVASNTMVPVGSRVNLRITIAGTSQMLELFGTVLDRSWAGRGSRASGLTIGFHGEEKRYAAQMIAFCAHRPAAMGTASSQRQEIHVRCKIKGTHVSLEAMIVDLSRTGAFIATEKLQGIQFRSQLAVQLEANLLGLGGTWVEGKVIWLGEKGGRTGFGIQFLRVGEKQMKILKKYLGTTHV